MDRIELAERQYERIAPKAGAEWTDLPIRKVFVWLKDHVCPVVEQYEEHPRFREQARWPLDALTGASVSPAGSLVADVDRTLVRAAKALLTLARYKSVASQIRVQNPPQKMTVLGTVEISTEDARPLEAVQARVDPLPLKEAQVRMVADHRYANLVSAEDYFGPVSGLLPADVVGQIREQGGTHITEGGFIASLNPELHLIGDFVTRCMFRRIDTLLACLDEYRRLCCQAIPAAGCQTLKGVGAEEIVWSELQENVKALRTACFTGRAVNLRDACIVLTQVYASFHPNPNLSWLGLPEHVVVVGVASLKQAVQGWRNLEVLDRISAALGNLREIQDTPEAAVELAIQTGGLVVVREPRSAYWNRMETRCQWDNHAKAFELLWKLAEKARFRGSVQDADLWDTPGVKNRLATVKERLFKLIPHDVSRLIKSARPGYRLHLEPKRIYIFRSRRA